MSTKVFLANVSSLSDATLFNLLYALMPLDRKKKIDEKKFAKDKNLSLGVGTLLRVATHDVEGAAIADFETGKVGDEFFNLSHSGELAMCIISDHECGCDVELKRDGSILEIADRFFYGEEKELINAQETQEKKIDMFFRLWTLKESFMKATHLGFKLQLDEFSVVPKLTQHPCKTPSLNAEKKLTQHVNNSNYKFFEYDIKNLQGLISPDCTDEYACSICLRDYDGEKPEIIKINLAKIFKTLKLE